MMQRVDVWCMPCETLAPHAVPSSLYALLGTQEHLRLKSIKAESYARMYVLSHAFLRVVLSSYEPAHAPHAWEWCYGAHGKPSVDVSKHVLQQPLFFNISHTSDCVVCAVSRDVAVGVDVENTTHQHPFVALAERYFSEEEALHVKHSHPMDTATVFYTYWTLREAFLKCTGKGISVDLKQCAMVYHPHSPWAFLRTPQHTQEVGLWRYSASPQHTIALAYGSSQNVDVRVYVSEVF